MRVRHSCFVQIKGCAGSENQSARHPPNRHPGQHKERFMKQYDSMWAALAASRISTLEELVHVTANQQRLASGEAVLLSNGHAEPAPPPDGPPPAPAIVHRFPSVPLLLDGQTVPDADALRVHDGRPLYYTPLRNGKALALAAFTSRERMMAQAWHLRAALPATQPAAASAGRFEAICTTNPDSLPDQVCFYEDIGEAGDVKCLAAGRAYPNLLQVGRVKVGWWYTSDWNDVISSVAWCRWDVTLYEHINYGGSQLFLPAGCNTPNLVELGWNDRASSVVNWGTRAGPV
jgi:hypothetical protein